MKHDVTTTERYLTLAALASYPQLALLVRGWVNGLFLIILILSMVFLIRTKWWLKKSTWDWYAVAFAVTMASYLVAIFFSQAFRQDFMWTPYDEALRLLLAVPIYLALRAHNQRVANVLGVACSLGAIFALIVSGSELQVGKYRLGSYFLNVIHFGDIALMLGLLSLFSIDVSQRQSPLLLMLKVVGLCAGVYLSFRSGTRGGWLAIPVLFGIWMLSNVKGNVRTAIVLILLLVGSVGIAGYFLFEVIHQRFLDFQSDIAAFSRGEKDTSTGIRIQILQAVFLIFEGNPKFGVGPEGYKRALVALANSGIITPLAMEMGIAEVHNQILNYAVKYGVLGFASGLAIHIVPLAIFVQRLRTADGENRVASLMGICLVTGFFIFGLTVEIFNLKSTITFYSLTLAALLAAATHPREFKKTMKL